jgi:hypothetical protein
VLRLVNTACKLIFHRAQRSGTGGDDSSPGGWIHVQCTYIKSYMTPLHTLLWCCARSLPLAHISRPQRILSTLTCPSLFTHHSTAFHYADPHPPFRRSLPLTPAPFTHSVALNPSFRLSSPLTPAPFTPALHSSYSAAFHPSLPHHSLPPFSPPHAERTAVTSQESLKSTLNNLPSSASLSSPSSLRSFYTPDGLRMTGLGMRSYMHTPAAGARTTSGAAPRVSLRGLRPPTSCWSWRLFRDAS